VTQAVSLPNDTLQLVTQLAIDAAAHRAGLSDRENCVVNMLVSGYSTKEIAAALYITAKTVKAHCNSIYRKTKCSGRLELVGRILERRG
jgi:DNA-binding CsgD family transcriptional regulator